MAGNRTIIGSETDDTKHVELDRAVSNNKVTLPVSIYDKDGNQVSLASGLVPKSFDSIALGYDSNGNLTTAVYSLSGTTVATLTLTYNSSNVLTNVTKT